MLLIVKNLHCFRGNYPILSKLSFQLDNNQIISLYGPNGSGKTTLLKTLAQIIPCEEGQILNEAIGTCILGHENCLKSDLTVLENLLFWAGVYKNNLTKPTISNLNLEEIINIPVFQLSAGQKRKVSLARLLISNCNLWLLDEPYASLDGNNQELFNKIMQNHLENEGGIIISAHKPIELKHAQLIEISKYKYQNQSELDPFIDGFEK